MSEAESMIEPNALDESFIISGLSSLSIGTAEGPPKSSSQTRKARLVLLQPLANAKMLQACRNPQSRRILKNDCLFTSSNELLDIQPVSRAWRQAIMNAPPFSHLIFDLTLPKETENCKDTFQKVHWDTYIPEENSLGVPLRDVMTLVRTIATEMKMRAKGDGLWFDVVYDEIEGSKGIAPRAMAILKKQLIALSQPAPEGKDGGKGELAGIAGDGDTTQAPEQFSSCHKSVQPNKLVFFGKSGERHEIYLPKGTIQKAIDLLQEENWDELLKFPPYTDQGYKDWD
ncbi:uncharacterized protein P174DRAFT_403998 [Aspergillus novofumigatus IBT 16806]|uniref:Uncharacterized protein n=1 Tax=Aspergillus novofumigatus (strain IBT 16806) TaxID=1392255 RepID=A0A2I1CCH3_ASPN1|nr:uncharacterized protein P174DRAFT_403998 [Aspergillus novofumigatus IBT 16806]PKX95328.1 hypothetical protein P174DRAFT_403998 [Aspergillus novofumigatus IBT 16806]